MKLFSECLGTFFLVLTIGLCVLEPGSAGAFAPLAIGMVLAVFIYAQGHLSGAHFNPAVSLAVYLRGMLSIQHLIGYWVAQLIGGVIAAYLVLYFKSPSLIPQGIDVSHAFVAELIFTFALCHIVLHVATAKETANKSYFGLAIGFILMVGIYSAGSISGGAFNPSVSLAACIMNLSSFHHLWLYLIAQLVAGALAALVFRLGHKNG